MSENGSKKRKAASANKPAKVKASKPSGPPPASSRPSSSTSSSTSSSATSVPSSSWSSSSAAFLRVVPSSIKNKMKRAEVFAKQKHEAKAQQSRDKKRRRKETAALGEDERAAKRERDAKRQKTIDNTREADETVVADGDAEVQADEAMDEFSAYFKGDTPPKIVITSGYKPTKRMYELVRDLLHVFPNSFYYARRQFEVAAICQTATEKGFTDVLIVNEDKKQFVSLLHLHLPIGPTAFYRLSSVRLCSEMGDKAVPTAHRPEVILNHFTTRLGHRVGRMLGALFHQRPEFRGRRVCTFHNQRDFIFFRHHRYVFTAKDKAALQEMGPRFTLKLKWLQHGLFDHDKGEYEFMHKTDMDTSRRRFFL